MAQAMFLLSVGRALKVLNSRYVVCSGLWCTVEVEGGTDFYLTIGTEEINTGGVEELMECY